jgi:hypothetical protein
MNLTMATTSEKRNNINEALRQTTELEVIKLEDGSPIKL